LQIDARGDIDKAINEYLDSKRINPEEFRRENPQLIDKLKEQIILNFLNDTRVGINGNKKYFEDGIYLNWIKNQIRNKDIPVNNQKYRELVTEFNAKIQEKQPQPSA